MYVSVYICIYSSGVHSCVQVHVNRVHVEARGQHQVSVPRLFVYAQVCVCVCGVDIFAGAYWDQKKVTHPPELELQAPVSQLTWILEAGLSL